MPQAPHSRHQPCPHVSEPSGPDWAYQSLRTHKPKPPTPGDNVFGHRTDSLKEIYGEYFLAELVDAQDEHMYCLVAEVDGLAKGFMSISDDVNFNLLNDCFELAPFHGLRKPHPDDVIYPPDKEMKLPKVLQRLNSAQLVDSPVSLLVRPDCYSGDVTISITEGLDLSETTRFKPVYFGGLNAFSIQLFAVDEKYETRSCDFLHTAFQLFPNYDFCIISIQHLVPEFPLIQNFVRVTPRCPSTLPQELYIFHRSGILKNFAVRTACSKDYSSVEMLVKDIQLKNNLLQDLTQFNIARRDPLW
ncbi:cilia- and flagella-associated protein 61-like [Babylonia areolata]|uniref:cilia- and flagella-associated protein 61-like n=1 Tax=Babylonia areolata TaxID=304850 RepID=UPI003FD5F299